MNEAHLHMVVNHFPIIGTILALGILIVGLILKNHSVRNTSYVLFIVAAIFGALSMGTGEGAEELVKDMPNVGWDIIHEHEEIAEKLVLLLYVLGLLSIIALYLNFKKNTKEKLVSLCIVGIGVVSLFLVQKVGTSGGEIRHTEIREGFQNTTTEKEVIDHDK
ncbi:MULTISPECIES: DUF2231 domain-containing protein [Flavobacterium]|uniref:DUF2231 domain-containing protein n=1 Tax=Flavobacterium keumense TaxID=1306518 RepID=A0ABY8N4L5_9FLAO|nr:MULTISPECIES: DUF2231 domain-containing protein [Flavobacterium]WGK94153.1 hypothetical protein MG292_08695 [Flavobacterium keumense]